MSRQQVETELYDILDKITFSKDNSNRYRELFKSMTDSDFHAFFKDIKLGKRKLPVFIPNHGSARMDFPTIIEVGESLGLKYYGRLINEIDGIEFKSHQEALVLMAPVRRLAQTLDAKISLPDNDHKVDAITGQVTSEAKAASISAIELVVLSDIGLMNTATESATVRGGDAGSYAYLKASTVATGQASLAEAMNYRTGVMSKNAVKLLLMCKHIKSNL